MANVAKAAIAIDLGGFPRLWFHKKKREHLQPRVVKAVRALIELNARKTVKKIDLAYDSLEAEALVDVEASRLKRVFEKRGLGKVVLKHFFLIRPLYWFSLVKEDTLPDYAEKFFKTRVAQLVFEEEVALLRKQFARAGKRFAA